MPFRIQAWGEHDIRGPRHHAVVVGSIVETLAQAFADRSGRTGLEALRALAAETHEPQRLTPRGGGRR